MSEDREHRAYRRQKKRQKTKRLMGIEDHTYIGTVWFDWGFDETGNWVRVGTYPKRRKNSRSQRFYKRYSNRIIRKSKEDYQYGRYRKAFDYWWTLY